MDTEFNKISILNITSFDFASFGFASFDKALLSEAEGLRTNGINQSFHNILTTEDTMFYPAQDQV